MNPRELPDKLTKCTAADLVWALWRAWIQLFGAPPKPKSIWVLAAQWALETGWGKSCHCWNLGNRKHVDGDGRCFTFYRCNEIIGGKVVWFDPPSPGCCFCAFQSLDEGALDYLAFLARRYAVAWQSVLDGDPAGFVHAIKLRGYFTAAEGPYRDAVVSIWGSFSRLPIDYSAMQQSADELPSVTTVGYPALLDLVRSEMTAERDSEVTGSD